MVPAIPSALRGSISTHMHAANYCMDTAVCSSALKYNQSDESVRNWETFILVYSCRNSY